MRWHSRTESNDTPEKRQQRRLRKAFLWLPLCAGDTWRWLEIAEWWEYYGPATYNPVQDLNYDYRWMPYRWRYGRFA